MRQSASMSFSVGLEDEEHHEALRRCIWSQHCSTSNNTNILWPVGFKHHRFCDSGRKYTEAEAQPSYAGKLVVMLLKLLARCQQCSSIDLYPVGQLSDQKLESIIKGFWVLSIHQHNLQRHRDPTHPLNWSWLRLPAIPSGAGRARLPKGASHFE